MDWFNTLEAIRSRGSQHESRGTLAGLHQDRAEHLGQFFTPEAIVRVMWKLITPAIDAIGERGVRSVSLMDNACGSGSLFRFAHPDRHSLFGVDVDLGPLEALAKATAEAGFRSEFEVASMASAQFSGIDVAVLNPPFSIQLESPHLLPFAVCSHGKFGPATSCLSHVYAVAQALDCAQVVAAVLPRTFADSLKDDATFGPRLRLILDLPRSAFRSEGAEVSTSLAIWGSNESGEFFRKSLDTFDDELPEVAFGPLYTRLTPRLRIHGLELSEPRITLPTTGDSTVRVVRHGRRLFLGFSCGLTEAKIRNAILGLPIAECRGDVEGRVPKGLQYSGEGFLDLEVHLAQPNPLASFKGLLDCIRSHGGLPEVDAGIQGYLKRAARQIKRLREPLRQVIRGQTASGAIQAHARAAFITNPSRWGSPGVRAGEKVEATLSDGKATVRMARGTWSCTIDEFNARFATAVTPEWSEKSRGRLVAFPEVAHQARAKAKALGIDKWLTWGYQFEDLLEMSIAPYGCICGWEMGLGKARLSLALCLLHQGPRNLIVVQAHLVDEMCTEIEKIGLPEDAWQVIRTPADLIDLRKINIIAYSRLRMPVAPGAGRRTYARLLRRRLSVVVADEGHLLRNQDTDQARSLHALSAPRRYLLTGTPIANYPRDLLPLIAWVYGDGTAAQPYGMRRAHLTPELRQSAAHAVRGIDAFREAFVSLEWSTNEFAENMTEGAKREVPRIANVGEYRKLLSPLVKRRISAEPDVATHIKIPTPSKVVHTIEWDDDHLAYYLQVAEEFKTWFAAGRDQTGQGGKNFNLIALLARIGAVESALNTPERTGKNMKPYYGGITSKQRFAVERLAQLTAEGHKTICFVRSPATATLLARLLADRGLESVVMHGGVSQANRTQSLRDEFRLGSVPVLLATMGVCQTGLNIPEADRVLFYARDWTAKSERQAMARVLRPQQKGKVVVEYIHLPGSLDEYQCQMVAFKGDAADAGLDWAQPAFDKEEFLHLDTILGRFCTDLGKMRGIGSQRLRDALVA